MRIKLQKFIQNRDYLRVSAGGRGPIHVNNLRALGFEVFREILDPKIDRYDRSGQ